MERRWERRTGRRRDKEIEKGGNMKLLVAYKYTIRKSHQVQCGVQGEDCEGLFLLYPGE